MAAGDSSVEIGFLEKTDSWKLDSRFFPCKVGGKPAWLDLKNINVNLDCGKCSKPCIFLCQLYAPIVKGDNYHRTIYLFVCKDPDCFKPNDGSNFIAYRCQLPVKNEFYPEGEPEEREDWHPQAKISNYTKTCALCGAFAGNRCGSCKKIDYCSRHHQVVDWKSGHNTKCGSSEESSAQLLFPEFEIICENEIIDDEDAEMVKKVQERSEEEKLKEYEEYVAKHKAGTLSNVDTKAIDELAFGKEDKYFKKFKERLKICPDQVIRYDKGGVPLWISEPKLTEMTIPNYVDSLEKSIDWGVLLVYTCKGNCFDGPSYKKEFLLKQDVAD